MRIGRFAIAIAIATLSGLLISTAAYAAKTVPINGSHIGNTTGATLNCSGPLATPPAAGHDGWHFVLPDSAGEDFTSVTITFSAITAGPITMTTLQSGAGWFGFLDATGSGDVKHAYIWTSPPGQTISAGTSQVEPTTPADPEKDKFNYSHGCPAGSSPSPSPSTSKSTSPSPSTSASTSPPVTPSKPVPSGGAETGGGGSYGVTILGISAIAVAASAGVVLLLARRRDELE